MQVAAVLHNAFWCTLSHQVALEISSTLLDFFDNIFFSLYAITLKICLDFLRLSIFLGKDELYEYNLSVATMFVGLQLAIIY